MSTASERPSIAVVVPFLGTVSEGRAAAAMLASLRRRPGDELVLVDNGETAPSPPPAGVRVVPAAGERSPAHARNAGASAATADWLLFLDADTEPPPDLLDRWFSAGPVPDDVGALAGGIDGVPGGGLAARYGAARGFLDAGAHLAHPYLPRAASANLLVRRAAWDAVGGFHEGVRAAEDTDLSWRLQRAGWRLAARPEARVAHRYRETLGGLRRQWRGYAAGRAWLGRRYDGFAPEPALVRAARRAMRRRDTGPPVPAAAATAPPPAASSSSAAASPPRTRSLAFAAIDAVLGFEELAGFLRSNRPTGPAPARTPTPTPTPTRIVVAARLPADPDPGDRVEAAGRGDRGGAALPDAAYREDDGVLDRLRATLTLVAAHPLRAARDRGRRRAGATASTPPLSELAPAALRIAALPGSPPVVAAADADPATRAVAARVAALAGRRLSG